MEKILCTVGILTFNSSGSIKDTIEAVKDFNEIIVCDGGSTDNTLEIVKGYGCKIIFQDPKFKRADNKIKDFSGVRNQILDSASYKWFFYIDSDELLSRELIEEISGIISGGVLPTAFWIPRKHTIDGHIIDCAATYPSKQMRLFHRDRVNRFVKTIHERIEVKEGTLVSQLNNVMLIPMTTDISAIHRKWNYYLDLEEEKFGKITLWRWLTLCAENLKVSVLYLFRFVRNLFFCRGRRMPLRLELQRYLYHINFCRRLFNNIVF